MTREEILEAITDDKMMPFIQPDQLANIVDFVIKNSQPSLPSNLDKAAEAHRRKVYYGDAEMCQFVREVFKAGAEWMAGQGFISEGKVFTSAFTSYVKTPGIEELLKDAFPEDTEVIVQVRKKQ